ncbi:DMT family transporter [Brevundimonas guildfordensis]|jgi:small multidrug resistance pump|uniref:DMT family transporter n=1 Tax=Brevundimonas guildfordensis TaxID=2762241 RepID=UPI00296AADC9|nr:multidrug efflux SMR transporter [Brevundimonas guildfordensis]
MTLTTWLALLGAIGFEVMGTTLLQQSQQFTRPWPTAGLAVCYGIAFYLLTLALKQMPVGLAYAIWSGLGVVLISVIGVFLFKQKLDAPAVLGLAMIIGGVVVINLFSRSVTH